MKRTFKKSMSILLAFALLFGSFAFGFSDIELPDFGSLFSLKADAANGVLYYQIYDGKVTITDCDDNASGDIVIPSSIKGYPVTSIGYEAFYRCHSITSVTIPDSVTSIVMHAFSYCTSLTSVTIGNGVTSIGEGAFSNCSSLTSVTIGNSVTSIGEGAFSYCTSLTSVTTLGSVTSIGERAFYYCGSLTSVTTLGSVTSIGDSTFLGCSSLTSITIPDSVTSIGDSAFHSCGSLTSVTIPDSVTSIGDYAFVWCKSLTSVTIPDSVTSIGYQAFQNCSSLVSITVDSANTSYSSDKYGVLFNKDKTKLILYPAGNTSEIYIIPNGVTSIDAYAFIKCDFLKTIVLPDSITKITSSAIQSCANLECVHIPESVTNISKYFITYSDNYVCSTTENCSAKEFADENGFEFRVCTGHNAIIPEPTTKPVVTEPATTKPVEVPTTTKPVVTEPSTTKPVEVPSTTKPATEPTKPIVTTKPTAEPTTKPSGGGFIFKILEPSVSVIKYGETLILHTNLTSISAAEKIEWSVDGEGVTIVPSEDGKTCAVTSEATGDVTITAKYVDENGVEHVSEQEIESKAGFFQKLISFFKNLFGISRIIASAFKF